MTRLEPRSDADAPTQDAFLSGRVTAWQPAAGYRAGMDAVFLAAACPAEAGQSVLDLGCGVGVAGLCLAYRTGARVVGVERQAEYAELARRNAVDTALEVVEGDLAALPALVRRRQFDHVIANPPYFSALEGRAPINPGRARALQEETPLETWVEVAARRLRPRGYFTLIQRASRLGDVLVATQKRLGSVCVLPILPRAGREASLVIVQARKEGKAPLRVLAPFVLHRGESHISDEEDDLVARARAILRDGAPLPLW